MDISSPCFVISVIVAVFAVALFFAASSKEDNHSRD